MLQNFAYYAQIMLHKFNTFFLFFYLKSDKIMSTSSLSSSSIQYEVSITHATIYLYIHVYQPFIVYVYVALWNLNLANTDSYMTKSYIYPNLTISYAKHVFISILVNYTGNFCLLCWHYAQCFSHPIMLKIMLA